MSGAGTKPCPVAQWAGKRPEGVALRSAAGEIAWREWHERIAAVSATLEIAGVGHGTRVGLCLPPGEMLLTLLLGIFRRGAVACPVNPQFPEAYRKGLLAKLDCAQVIDVDEPAQVRDNIVSAAYSTSPTPPQAGVTFKVGAVARKENRFPTSGSGFTLVVPPACGEGGGVKRGTKSSDDSSLSVWSIDQPATIVFTSGSTGEPKAAVLSLGNHLESAYRSNGNIPLGPDETWLLSLPLHHVAGYGVVFRCLAAGATIALPDPNTPWIDSLTASA